jgi:signal transduction histidine kinase
VLFRSDGLGDAGSDEGTGEATALAMPEPPQPTLTDVPHLVEEWRSAGARITLIDGDILAANVPVTISRTAYRIVQESLTNAGKHAPSAKVDILLGGKPGESLTISIANPLGVSGGASSVQAAIPGTGLGLVGLSERVELVGGAFAAGVDPELLRFVVEARLPWSAA